ncbi:uncharacterized protein KQ657_002875 [Scheffersomyces spartinae]|uniref:MHD domain-containing protein n=1 Tax=Scheffersomyces spartinae TaxID=45513 RepID=A0A9P8AGH6_9ASCO|nr:uncharacterized protein KQ657_002875 [Scheffersomyces spartinae]KAG7191739.1 hypothetical protein KQ657_002875 [Scheffersomyces spartinae]
MRCIPVLLIKGLNYIFYRTTNDLIFLGVTRQNIDVMETIWFLKSFQHTLSQYVYEGRHHTTEESNSCISKTIELDRDVIMDNFNLIYELFDECVDFGIPQMTNYNVLREFIKVGANLPQTPESHYSSEDDDDDNGDAKNGTKQRSLTKLSHNQSKLNQTKMTSSSNMAKKLALFEISASVNPSILRDASLKYGWRPKGIFYAKNEIYVDIVEDCEFHYDLQTQRIRKNDIYGTIAVKCYLSGMPLCKIGFNESNMSRVHQDEVAAMSLEEEPEGNQLKSSNFPEEEEEETAIKRSRIPLGNINFHQCVQLEEVISDNLIRFLPPDDRFILLTYHVEQQKQIHKLPIVLIEPKYIVHRNQKTLVIQCTLTSNYWKRLKSLKMLVKIPINPHLFDLKFEQDDDLKFKAEMGDVKYNLDSSELFWTIHGLSGKHSVRMMAEFSLQGDCKQSITQEKLISICNNRFDAADDDHHNLHPEDEIDESQRELDEFYGVNGAQVSLLKEIKRNLKRRRHEFNNISIGFEIPLMTYSGLKLTYLRVDEDQMKYTCFPWVKYTTISGFKTTGGNANIESNCNYRFKLGIRCFQLTD